MLATLPERQWPPVGWSMMTEVDDIDPVARTGWSVLVTGFAEEVTDPDELEACGLLPLGRWAGSGDRFVRISTDLISGRRAGMQFAAADNGLRPAPEVVG